MVAVSNEVLVENGVANLVDYLKKHYPSMESEEMKLYTNKFRAMLLERLEEERGNKDYHASQVFEEILDGLGGHEFKNTLDNFYENTYADILMVELGLTRDFLEYVHHEEKTYVSQAYEDRLSYQKRYTFQGDYTELALMIAKECRSKRLDRYKEAYFKS